MSEPTYGHNPPSPPQLDGPVHRPLPPAHRPSPYPKAPTRPVPRNLLARLRARFAGRWRR